MTRAVLLPAGPDPFLLAYWLRHFRQWADEIDELRILICGVDALDEHDPRVEMIRSVGSHFAVETIPNRLDHGRVIARLLAATSADHVMLCEDDAFIRRPIAVDAAFRRVESGAVDIVGSPRGSISGEIEQAAAARFGGTITVASGESGNSLWPCFLFARRETLLATDGDFSAHGWSAGERIATLDYVPVTESAGDTFVHATYQLRDRGARIHWLPQYRADFDRMPEWLAQDPSWFHVGSLSAGYGYTFLNGDAPMRARIAEAAKPSAHDWEKRISWWRRAILAMVAMDVLPDQRAQYLEELEEFTDLAGLSRRNIAAWTERFEPWVTW